MSVKVKQLIASLVSMVVLAILIIVVIYFDISIQVSTKAITTNGIVEQMATEFNAVPILFFLSTVGLAIGVIACLDSLGIISLDKIKGMFQNEE